MWQGCSYLPFLLPSIPLSLYPSIHPSLSLTKPHFLLCIISSILHYKCIILEIILLILALWWIMNPLKLNFAFYFAFALAFFEQTKQLIQYQLFGLPISQFPTLHHAKMPPYSFFQTQTQIQYSTNNPKNNQLGSLFSPQT